MRTAVSFVVFLALLAAAVRSPAAEAVNEKSFTQIPEVARSQLAAGAAESAPVSNPQASAVKNALATGSVPSWIWGADFRKNYYLRTEFSGGSVAARLKATCDNGMTVWVNGHAVATSSEWQSPVEVDVQKHIQPGNNVLLVEVTNEGAVGGFVLKLALVMPDGKASYVVSDGSWQVATSKGAKEWSVPKVIGKLGIGPWRDVLDRPSDDNAANRDVFNVLPGFQVERLFTVPKDVLGSWVSITLDQRGRIIVSDQGDKGLCRITPPPTGSTQPTKVERLDVKMTSAHSMLSAFGGLYVSANGGPGSGLYRLRDINGDDQYDEVTKLKEIRGGGEHGPHGLRLSPDGKSICLICGNHTRLPFDVKTTAPVQTMGGVRAEQLHAELPPEMTSRIAPNWDEDLLLPRQWDANGHAAGILAPGGWIAQTDPEGKHWEILSVGYRNPYDMAFNADGELFAYDADMEWDFGMPWYRPTRVTHAVSGSEFGWRSGTGKWPAYYVDIVPPLVNIGPGSPVGVEFGYGAKFPAKYQKALYILDWTFGTIYAIHMEPDGAGYKAVKEEFVSRSPLPLTDAVVGRDGALYFTVGGRGTQSELFRVTYIGPESTAPVDVHDPRQAELRALRHKIEGFHGNQNALSAETSKAAVDFLAPLLGHPDQRIRYAARVALERFPVDRWQDRVLNSSDSETIITGVIGLARQAESAIRPQLIAALGKLDFDRLSEMQKLALLRAYQLVFIRLGLPDEGAQSSLGAAFDARFPGQSELISRELAILMVALSSSNAAHKLVPILTRERVMSQLELGDVASRNRGYGAAVAAVQANQPDQLQMAVAFALRNLKKGWTLEEKKTYFRWFAKARQWSGGNSYQKFLTNIENDAFANSTDAERLAVEAAGARQPYKAPELPKPVGPGRDYTLDELLALSNKKMQGRNFKNGMKMFAAARCVICHRFAGDGGSTGPDLTQAAGRFSLKDLAESIVNPSKVISDQYRTTIVQTAQGRAYTGRVIAVADESITLLIDPEDASKTVEIKKADIEAQEPSPVSLMPKDLLKPLNEKEVLDLLAYILSRGNPQDPMYRK
jgi:putative heme-binding domain-containing protein